MEKLREFFFSSFAFFLLLFNIPSFQDTFLFSWSIKSFLNLFIYIFFLVSIASGLSKGCCSWKQKVQGIHADSQFSDLQKLGFQWCMCVHINTHDLVHYYGLLKHTLTYYQRTKFTINLGTGAFYFPTLKTLGGVTRQNLFLSLG